MQEQTHFEVTSDNDKIKEKLSNESQLCFVLNPKLTKNQLWTLCGEGYLVECELR